MHAPPLRAAVRHHFLKSGSQGADIRHMAAAAQFFQKAGIALLLARKKKVHQHGPCGRKHFVHGGASRFPDHYMAGGKIGRHAARPAAHRQPASVSGSQIPDAGINAPEPAPQNTGYMQGGIRIQHTRQLRPRMPCGTLGKVKHPERLPFLPGKRMLLRQRPQHGIDGKSRNAQPVLRQPLFLHDGPRPGIRYGPERGLGTQP